MLKVLTLQHGPGQAGITILPLMKKSSGDLEIIAGNAFPSR